MKFKELFDNTILTEAQHLRKSLKIFYEIDLDLHKPEEHKPEEQKPEEQPAPAAPAAPAAPPPENPGVPPEAEAEMSAPPNPTPEQPSAEEPPAEQPPIEMGDNGMPQLSVNTEGLIKEDEVAVNDENVIIRKFEGEISLSDKEIDNIQTIDDIIDILSSHKKDGTKILDDFSTEIIQLCTQQNFNEIKQKLDKKSKIFLEIGYGFKKDDSVSCRFNKRKNADTLTSTMLIDNEIISSKFSIDKVNTKIAEYRNYAVNKK